MKRKSKIMPALSKAAAAQLERDVAAYDAMSKTRPMKPPPLRLLPAVMSAAQRELRSSRRLGVAA